jgi:hypothetical protein
MIERENQIVRDDVWLLGNAKLIEYEVNCIKQCGIFYKGKEIYWHYLEKEDGMIDLWNDYDNIYIDKEIIENSKNKLFEYKVNKKSSKKAMDIVKEIKNTIDLSKETIVNIDNYGYDTGEYKYHYIPKIFQKPYFFYKKMVDDNGYSFYNKALDISSKYYNVDRDKLEEIVRDRINSGRNHKKRLETKIVD